MPSTLSSSVRVDFPVRAVAALVPPELVRVAEQWVRYSVVEPVMTSALLVALIALGRLLWREYVRGDTSGRAGRLAVASLARSSGAARCLLYGP